MRSADQADTFTEKKLLCPVSLTFCYPACSVIYLLLWPIIDQLSHFNLPKPAASGSIRQNQFVQDPYVWREDRPLLRLLTVFVQPHLVGLILVWVEE